MRPLLSMFVLLAAGLAFAVPASAQMQIGDRGDIAGATTLDWNNYFAGDGSFLSNPFTVGHNGLDVTVAGNGSLRTHKAGTSWSGGFSPGDGLLFNAGGTSVDIVFANMVGGFGTQIWHNYPTAGEITLTAYREGLQIFTFALQTGGGAAANNNQATLFGLTDAAGFDRVTMESASGEFAFNQLTLGIETHTVPEPMSMLLLGSGLFGVGIVHRRRKNLVG